LRGWWLLVDNRERLVRMRVAINNDLLWHLHDLWPELKLPGGALVSKKWSAAIGRRLARAEQTARVRIARDELRRLRELTVAVDALETEIADLVTQVAPHLLSEPGFGPLTAAKLIGEIGGPARFSSDAKLARAAGVAPIPASSGKSNRHRLDRGGNRQLNATLHRIAITRARCHPENQGLPRPQASRRQDHPRSHPLPQTPPRPPHLATPAHAPPRPRNTAITINFLT
jgi:transposase